MKHHAVPNFWDFLSIKAGKGVPLSPVIPHYYFKAPANKEAGVEPPLDCTNPVSTGTNFAAIAGDSPNFLNDPATEAKPPKPPGREDWTPERLGRAADAGGADLIRLSIPGTLAATLLKSVGPSRLLASPNSAPAPPLACAGVMESAFVNCPISSGLAVFANVAGTSAASAICAKNTKKTAAAMDMIRVELILVFMSSLFHGLIRRRGGFVDL